MSKEVSSPAVEQETVRKVQCPHCKMHRVVNRTWCANCWTALEEKEPPSETTVSGQVALPVDSELLPCPFCGDTKPKLIDETDAFRAAIAEIAEQADYKRNGPKDHAKCPDCGATLAVRRNEKDRYELSFVKHDET